MVRRWWFSISCYNCWLFMVGVIEFFCLCPTINFHLNFVSFFALISQIIVVAKPIFSTAPAGCLAPSLSPPLHPMSTISNPFMSFFSTLLYPYEIADSLPADKIMPIVEKLVQLFLLAQNIISWASA